MYEQSKRGWGQEGLSWIKIKAMRKITRKSVPFFGFLFLVGQISLSCLNVSVYKIFCTYIVLLLLLQFIEKSWWYFGGDDIIIIVGGVFFFYLLLLLLVLLMIDRFFMLLKRDRDFVFKLLSCCCFKMTLKILMISNDVGELSAENVE